MKQRPLSPDVVRCVEVGRLYLLVKLVLLWKEARFR